jgi:outer membrane protein OmpA-like peptidoglycan-associated protein
MKSLPLAVAALAAVLVASFSAGVYAQTTGKVLKDNEVTEENLIDALKLSPEETEGIRTRSLRVGPAAPVAGTQGGGGAPQPPAAAPRRDISMMVTFVTNSAALTNRAQQLLDVVGRALKNDQLAALKFMVEGHADPRGNKQANLSLSRARAESVRKYLVATHGIPEDRLAAVGKGDSELLNTANPAAPENRRVTFVTRVE